MFTFLINYQLNAHFTFKNVDCKNTINFVISSSKCFFFDEKIKPL
jgi:hypothetical protein